MNMPVMPVPNTEHETHTIHYYGLEGEYTIYTVDREIDFPDGALITSRTDLNGIITHANDSFVLMSGWPREDLIGAPHSILRHPDMPSAAFADLWNTVSQGVKWHGYVKNLRRDGCHYWVYATVIPNIRNGEIQGYTSVRRRPPRSKIEEMSALYRQMLEEEKVSC